VYTYTAYRIGGGADAEDVTSEVFEHALRYRDSYDPSKGEPIAWLLGIARRCLASRTTRPFNATLENRDIEAPGDLEGETIERVTIARTLRRLTQRDRELIALRYAADLSARQIGELMDMSTNAVEVALHRALQRLRTELEPDEISPRTPHLLPDPKKSL